MHINIMQQICWAFSKETRFGSMRLVHVGSMAKSPIAKRPGKKEAVVSSQCQVSCAFFCLDYCNAHGSLVFMSQLDRDRHSYMHKTGDLLDQFSPIVQVGKTC